MTLSVIRSFTESDKERLDESALRFAERHQIYDEVEYYYHIVPFYIALETHLETLDVHNPDDRPELKRLWQACKCRALKVPVSARIAVAYGYIGNSVN